MLDRPSDRELDAVKRLQLYTEMLRSTARALKFPQRLGVYTQHRIFSLSAPILDKPLPPRLKINDADITISYLKGTGPGGQKINKTNSAVQIIHKPTGLVVKSQATRSQSQNEKIARQLLADRVEELEKGDQSRTAIKADRARKKKASKLKKTRRKYRDLEGKQSEGGEEGEEGDDHSEGEDHTSQLDDAVAQPSPEQRR